MMLEDRQKLRDAALAAVNGTRARSDVRRAALAADWKLQTSNSFRRIGAHGDGDVLCGTKHPVDGQPDLLAAPGVLDYIVVVQPRVVLALLDQLDRALPVFEAALKMRHRGDKQRVHEAGCGNNRPCDACDFDAAIDQAMLAVERRRALEVKR